MRFKKTAGVAVGLTIVAVTYWFAWLTQTNGGGETLMEGAQKAPLSLSHPQKPQNQAGGNCVNTAANPFTGALQCMAVAGAIVTASNDEEPETGAAQSIEQFLSLTMAKIQSGDAKAMLSYQQYASACQQVLHNNGTASHCNHHKLQSLDASVLAYTQASANAGNSDASLALAAMYANELLVLQRKRDRLPIESQSEGDTAHLGAVLLALRQNLAQSNPDNPSYSRLKSILKLADAMNVSDEQSAVAVKND
jgi:hypothetical protein